MERKTAKILGVFLALVLPVLMIATASLAGVDWKAELGDHSGKTLRVIMIADPWVPAFEKINPEFEELTLRDWLLGDIPAQIGEILAEISQIKEHMIVINHEMGQVEKQQADNTLNLKWLVALWWKFLLAVFLLFAGTIITALIAFIVKLLF